MASGAKQDLRVVKTLDAIHSAFTEMLLERPFSKITVTALCERARINKKTFYRYYQTLDDLLQELEQSYITPYVKLTSGLRYPDDVCEITRIFLEYCAEQGELFDAIAVSGSHERILKQFITGIEADRYTYSKPPEGWTPEEWNLYMVGVTSSQLRFYQQWVEDGRKVPLDRMVDIACRLICNGAILY